jgi:hypothetical protein
VDKDLLACFLTVTREKNPQAVASGSHVGGHATEHALMRRGRRIPVHGAPQPTDTAALFRATRHARLANRTLPSRGRACR